MATTNRLSGFLILLLSLLWITGCTTQPDSPSKTFHSELEYLQVLNDAGPALDPQIIFLLMAQYMNANQNKAGIDFFSSFLEKHEERLAPLSTNFLLPG